MGGQRLDGKPVGMAGDQVQRASADRAGRTEDREAPRRRIGNGLLPGPSGSTCSRVGSV